MRILAIETSCDETAIAIAEFSGTKRKPRVRVLSHIVSSQVKLHAKFGGVVPNLAKREHQRNLAPILIAALKEAGLLEKPKTKDQISKAGKSQILQREPVAGGERARTQTKNENIFKTILEREQELLKNLKKHILPLEWPEIDAIAVTYGPGLEPALWVGVNFARALAYLWQKPIIPVNHMAGHIYSSLAKCTYKIRSHLSCELLGVRFPALTLLVSGGHTQLVLMRGHGGYKLLGETRDDAAGEAFDKVARLLGLGYPGGPVIAAEAAKIQNYNSKFKINLPRPMLHTKDYDFSFSGLKTAVFYLVRDVPGSSLRKLRPSIAKEFQDAVVEVLVKKTIKAAEEYKVKTILLGGGVAANKKLRHDLGEAIAKEIPSAKYYMPDTDMTGDNALMIALAAFFTGKKTNPEKIRAEAQAQL